MELGRITNTLLHAHIVILCLLQHGQTRNWRPYWIYAGARGSDQCGSRQSLRIRPAIRLGSDALPGSWPWQVSLQFRNPWDGSYYHVCGGTLIDATHILTAAHCLDANLQEEGRDDPTKYKILLGGHSQSAPSGNEQILNAQSFILHEDWTADITLGLPNDIALVKLATPADISQNHVASACIPESEVDFSAAECWITGWGLIEEDNEYSPDVLQEARGTVVVNPTCQSQLPDPVLDTHICVGGAASPTACAGDSGGPLSCRKDNNWFVAGVSSWVYACSGYPSVYTRVSTYSAWIDLHRTS